MDRNHPNKAINITHSQFHPFPGGQIQCAVVVPGISTRIVMVNHSNEVFILKFENSGWNSTRIKVRLENDHGEIVRVEEKMSIAAMDGGIVRLFWIHGQDGGMLTIDTNKISQVHPVQSQSITTPF